LAETTGVSFPSRPEDDIYFNTDNHYYSLLAAVFVISMAKTTPSLASLVPDFDELIGMVIEMTEPWARHHEAADATLSIFKTIRQKLRLSVATLL
jgi:hypothetical protein